MPTKLGVLFVCLFFGYSSAQACGTFSNCSSCLAGGVCGWCAETQTCQVEPVNCVQWSTTDCQWECSKHDYDCNICQQNYANASCGWCHGAVEQGSSKYPTGLCLTIQPQTNNTPNTKYTCEAFLLPGTDCPNCTQHNTNCTACIENPYCGVCTPNNLPNEWQCQEGNANASFGFCKSKGALPTESWSNETCGSVCPAYGTCNFCTRHSGCSWCELTVDQTVGKCLPTLADNFGQAQCTRWANITDQCPGNSYTRCEDRVSCSDCNMEAPGSPFECGWCESDDIYKCMNASDSASCTAGNWYNSSATCPVHCPGYPISECSGNGFCFGNGSCNCSDEYYGPLCAQYCSDTDTCSGHGLCFFDKDSVEVACQCFKHYYDEACSIFCEPNVTCNGRGVCNPNNGLCHCDEGFYGANCEPIECSDFSECYDCNANDFNKSCVWCENANLCIASTVDPKEVCDSDAHVIDNALVCTKKSCSDMSRESCISGDHCDCFWCEGRSACYNVAGKTAVSCTSTIHKCSESSDKLSGGIIALIVLLCVGFVLLVAAVVLYFVYKRKGGYTQFGETQALNEHKYHSQL
jgi:hypothetical protein